MKYSDETLAAIKNATKELNELAENLGTPAVKADPTGIIFDSSVIVDDDYREDKMKRTAQRLLTYLE